MVLNIISHQISNDSHLVSLFRVMEFYQCIVYEFAYFVVSDRQVKAG